MTTSALSSTLGTESSGSAPRAPLSAAVVASYASPYSLLLFYYSDHGSHWQKAPRPKVQFSSRTLVREVVASKHELPRRRVFWETQRHKLGMDTGGSVRVVFASFLTHCPLPTGPRDP